MSDQRPLELLICVAVLLMLGGCYDVPSSAVADTKDRVAGLGGVAGIVEKRLEDGTRCVVLIGGHQGAIACDWENKNVE